MYQLRECRGGNELQNMAKDYGSLNNATSAKDKYGNPILPPRPPSQNPAYRGYRGNNHQQINQNGGASQNNNIDNGPWQRNVANNSSNGFGEHTHQSSSRLDDIMREHLSEKTETESSSMESSYMVIPSESADAHHNVAQTSDHPLAVRDQLNDQHEKEHRQEQHFESDEMSSTLTRMEVASESAPPPPETVHYQHESIDSIATNGKYSCILHFSFPPEMCVNAQDTFYVRCNDTKILLTKYSEGHFWANIVLYDGIKSVRYEVFWMRREQKADLFSKVGTYFGGSTHHDVEMKVAAGTASFLQYRLNKQTKFKGNTFCLRASGSAEMQMVKFLSYVCCQEDFEPRVALRDIVPLFSDSVKQHDLLLNNGYLEQVRALLKPQQSSLFPLVAAVCLGAMQRANTSRTIGVLSNAPQFPSTSILRAVMNADVLSLNDPLLQELAVVGVSALVRHNLTHSMNDLTCDLAWLEKAANNEFLDVVLVNSKSFGNLQLSDEAETSFIGILVDFQFTDHNVELFKLLFKMSKDRLACKEAVLNCFFRTARSVKTKNTFSTVAMRQVDALLQDLSLSDLVVVARIAKTHHSLKTDLVVASLRNTLTDCVLRSTLADVQKVSVEDFNCMFLDEHWLDVCIKRIHEVAPRTIEHIFDSNLVVYVKSSQHLPVLATAWMECILTSYRYQRDEQTAILETVSTVLDARMFVQKGAQRLKATQTDVCNFETKVLGEAGKFLSRMNTTPWTCVTCVPRIADLIRPVNELAMVLSNDVVAWLRGKLEESFAQLANDPDASMRLLKAIYRSADKPCAFTEGVLATLLDLLTEKLPLHMTYADAIAFSVQVRAFHGLQDDYLLALLEKHPKYKQIKVFVTKLLGTIVSEDILVRELLQLKTVQGGGADWKTPLLNFAIAYKVNVTPAMLNSCEETIASFQAKLVNIRAYLNNVEKESGETSSGFVTDALVELNRVCTHLEHSVGSLAAKVLRGPAVWGRARELMPMAEEFHLHKESQLFLTTWRREFGTRASVELVDTELEPGSERRDAVQQFITLCEDANTATDTVLNAFLLSFATPNTLKIKAMTKVWVAGLNCEDEYRTLGDTKYRNKLAHFWSQRQLLEALTNMNVYRNHASGLLDALKMFVGVDATSSSAIVDLSTALSTFEVDAEDASLWEIHECIENWHAVVTTATSNHFDSFVELLSELRGCGEVISFLYLLRPEKNVNLIDMVEENSDSIVRAETVAEFDAIRRAFRQLILSDRERSPGTFLTDLTTSLLVGIDRDVGLAAKLHSCKSQIHSIRDIWFSVAKREESTKKLCRKINETGVAIWCRTEDSEFSLVVTCLNADHVLEYKDQVTVEELRSRALLLVNTVHKAFGTAEDEALAASDKEQLRTFIDIVTPAMQVTHALSELIKLGHFDFQKPLIKVKFGAEELSDLLQSILAHKNEWEHQLRVLRSEKYYTNFFFSTQFWQLHKFFSGQSLVVAIEDRLEAIGVLRVLEQIGDAVVVDNFFAVSNAESLASDRKKSVALLQYVNHTFPESVCLIYEKCYDEQFADLVQDVDTDEDGRAVGYLKALGNALHRIFYGNGGDIEDLTLPGGEPVSFLLYRDNSGLIPLLFGVYPHDAFERNQLLVCESNTSLEEMSMFLMRVFSGDQSVAPTAKVYTVMNLQQLSHNSRASFMRLMTHVKNNRHPENLNSLVLLLIDDIKSCVDGMRLPQTIGVTPRKETDIRNLFRGRAAQVEVVTSVAAGMGKTEYCAIEALKNHQLLNTVLVTDGMSRHDFVSQIQHITITPHHCLHLDVSNLAHQSEIAIGLFEILFLGTSQINTTVVHWDVNSMCFVECANSVSNRHTIELDTLRYFPSKAITWSLNAVVVKQDLDSDIQVVCNYLLRLEAGTLSSAELIFPGKSEHDERAVTAVAVSAPQCHRLLNKYFYAGLTQAQTPSASVLVVFLHVLAVQLRRFSASGQFVIEYMTDPRIRSTVVDNMVVCSKDFAIRSVVHARNRQHQNALNVDENGETSNECEGLLKWEDSDQTMVCIADNSLVLLYKKLASLNAELVTWYNFQTTQADEKLAPYHGLSPENLRETYEGRPDYVLTPDNFLKCVMILLRVQAGVPVVVMGEAGCGKTSLVRFLGEMCNASIYVLSIHAGVDRAAIAKQIAVWIKVHCEEMKATGSYKSLWIFLDEINTCSELGFINSIICHRVLPGVRIPKCVSFFAACNPFKRRVGEVGKRVGLATKTMGNYASKGDGLVYRVKPLPETMLDYIWDFGSLTPQDEKLYIAKFIGQLATECRVEVIPAIKVLVEQIAMSQSFIRQFYTAGTVSMRDVRRVKILFAWFLKHKLPLKDRESGHHLKKAYRCIVLALAQCYRCRLPTTDLRETYDAAVSDCFAKAGVRMMNEVVIQKVIRDEQLGYLHEMTVPVGIALNDSLVENVFVLLVCILNKIPVFIVGKPGSSKSLSIVLINSNMRGRDSDSAFFRTLPEVKIICFQGSESSTSEGILKIFRKAEGFVSKATDDDLQSKNVIPVVLIDEIGLAEISPFNPLKVLHRQLETDDDRPLDIAVIGISNWELDLSKMSRAVYLARPEPDATELGETAMTIMDTIYGRPVPSRIKAQLQDLSSHYVTFCSHEEISGHANFHGLRDFYSTCKQLGHVLKANNNITSLDITYALLRNFGGLSLKLKDTAFKPFFEQAERDQARLSSVSDTSVVALVAHNLQDKNARHLMLISEGDSILTVIGDSFEAAGVTKYRIIIGSKFKGDRSENYRYRMLSEIILCMERGESLALRDMDDIYQSLYDMLNQNYTVVAGKKNCRIALGAFSNPVAHVHDDFKCIVMPDAKKVYGLDPPFLNRFEKHVMDFHHVLQPMHHKVVKALEAWVEYICQVDSDQFTDRDTFVGFSTKGTLSSLVRTVAHQSSDDSSESEMLWACKGKLVHVATFQGMVRALSSQQASFAVEETRMLFDAYVADKRHISLKYFVGDTVESGVYSKSVVSTFSNFYFLDVAAHQLSDAVELAYSKLSAFDTELELVNFVSEYFASESQNVLIIQCDVAVDEDKLMMTKFIIDKAMRVYKEVFQDEDTGSNSESKCGDHCAKHVILLLHTKSEMYQEDRLTGHELFFSADWDAFHIDNLEQDEQAWDSVQRIIEERQTLPHYLSEHDEVFGVCFDDMLSCFRHIKYNNEDGNDTQLRVKELCVAIKFDSPALQGLLRDKVLMSLEADSQYQTEDWIMRVASGRENLEFSSSSLAVAVTSYAVRVVRDFLSQCVYLFEKYSSFDPYLHKEFLPEYERNVFLYANELNLAYVSPASGPDCFEVDIVFSGLQFAFSALLEDRLDEIKLEYTNAQRDNKLDERTYLNCTAEIVTVIDNFAAEIGMCDRLNLRLYCADVIKLFSKKTSRGEVLPHQLVEHVVNSLLELLNCTVTTPDILYPLLWGRSSLILNMVAVMNISRGSSLQVATPQRVDQLCEEYNAPDADVVATAVFALFVDFCKEQWNLLVGVPFVLSNLLAWSNTVQSKLPRLLKACLEVKFDFTFDFLSDSDDEVNPFNAALMPYNLNLKVVLDLCKLLQQAFGDSIPSENAPLSALLTTYFADAPSAMNSDWLANLMRFIDQLAAELPSTMSGSVARFKYETLKRFMLLPPSADVDHRDAVALLTSTVYQQVGRSIVQDAINPPLACRELVSILVERLYGMLFDVAVHEKVTEERNEQGLFVSLCDFDTVIALAEKTDAIRAFEALFRPAGGGEEETPTSVSGSKLETMMTDMLFDYLTRTDDLELDDEDCCAAFTAVMARWEGGFDTLGLVERMFGVAFCRLFLDNAASQLDSNAVVSDLLNQTLANTLGSDRVHPLYHTCRIYVLKAMRIPQHELKSVCVAGGWLHTKAPWVSKYAWQPTELVTRLLPLRDKTRDEAVTLAWDEKFHPFASSNEKMNALLASVPNGDNATLKSMFAIAFGAKCRTAAANDTALDISSILTAWPEHADPRWKVLFQVVHSRFAAPCALPNSDFDLDDVCLLNIVASLMNVDSPQFQRTVFGSYIADAQAVKTTYVMGAHSSDLATVMRAHGNGIGYYRCPCGYVYEIENCMLPGGHVVTCNCGRVLGGHNHQFTEAGTARVEVDVNDPQGYHFPEEFQNSEEYSVRGLTRNESRILSLLVHSCALIGLYTKPADFTDALGVEAGRGDEAVRRCWNWIKANWTILCRTMSIEGDRKELLCALLMQLIHNIATSDIPSLTAVLNTMPLREEAETAFAALCSPLIDNFAVVSLAALNEWKEPVGEALFERELQERDAPTAVMPKCFRLLKVPSNEDVHNAYRASAITQLSHPLIGIYFQFEKDLHRIKDLIPLMRWPTSVRKNLNFEFSLTSIGVSAVDVLAGDPRLFADEYKEFESAWNRFQEASSNINNDRYFNALLLVDCHQVTLEKLAPTDPILYSCARLTHIGREAPYMSHVLGEIQNKFLAAVNATRPENERSENLTRRCLHDATETDVITHDSVATWKALHRYVRANLDYGAGSQIECDWQQMEQVLKERLVNGKTLLRTALLEEGALHPYRYTQEMFQDQADLFTKLNALVPQATSLPDVDAIRTDAALSDEGEVDTKLFPALNNLLFMLLKQRKTAVSPDMTLFQFAKAHLDNDAHWEKLNSRRSGVVNLTLSHVEALYELMEDVISTTVIGCLHAKFRDDIDRQLLDDVYKHLVPLAGDISTLECIVRRFIIRYLRNPDAKNSTDALYYYITQMRWPDSVAGDISDKVDADEDLERIFNALTLGHVGSLQQALQQRIDETKENERREQQQRQQDQNQQQQQQQSPPDDPPTAGQTDDSQQQHGPKKGKKPMSRAKGNTHQM
eukprot:gene21951-28030_t